ncbi:MAG TPA: hypothetical protein VNT55_24165, partial [Baekduia sp.]|nr:hypothetical protein [Baekduia sp.]
TRSWQDGQRVGSVRRGSMISGIAAKQNGRRRAISGRSGLDDRRASTARLTRNREPWFTSS